MIDQERRNLLVDEIGEAFVLELTNAFWDDAWTLFGDATSAMAAGDAGLTRRALHTIAGSAGNIGLEGIATAAEAANQCVKSGMAPDFQRLRAAMDETFALIGQPEAA